jgi:type IV pilus assembly protein PilW
MHRFSNKVSDWITNDGFTLVELLIAMALMGIAMTAIYTTYLSQQKVYALQIQVANMQQNLRTAMYFMVSDMHMAGYDKENTGTFGLVSSMVGFTGSGATCDSTNIAFTLDDDEDGNLDSNDLEMIAYRLNGTNLDKFTTAGGGTWRTIALNIDALNFVYLDSSRAVTTDLTSVRFIEVTVLAQTARGDRDYTNTTLYVNRRNEPILPGAPNDNLRRKRLTSIVKCRNLGL